MFPDLPDDLPSYDDIHSDRVQCLNDAPRHPDKKYVLYWMQQSMRVEWNHALEYAIRLGNDLGIGVVVCFGLTKDYPNCNLRHYQFMLEGLSEVSDDLLERDIKFVLRLGSPVATCLDLVDEAAALICDRGYLRHQQKWCREVSSTVDIQVIQVESNLVVPVEVASEKREYAARTIRSNLMDKYNDYLEQPKPVHPVKATKYYNIDKVDLSDINQVLNKLDIDRSVNPSEEFKGGTSHARKRFSTFLNDSLAQYTDKRQKPSAERVSYQSMYLHWGQISPCYLVSELNNHHKNSEEKEAYLEEILVRRELAHNFVYYTPDEYDSFSSLPDWAADSLEKHRDDERPAIHTRRELENGETNDHYWNIAMKEMRERGYLHNHLRMYWGKQLLRWTNTPEYAYKTALYLNNKYFLDGGDANSYANILWLFGLHDRAWEERDVYGKVRVMTPSGLKRKIDVDAFLAKLNGVS